MSTCVLYTWNGRHKMRKKETECASKTIGNMRLDRTHFVAPEMDVFIQNSDEITIIYAFGSLLCLPLSLFLTLHPSANKIHFMGKRLSNVRVCFQHIHIWSNSGKCVAKASVKLKNEIDNSIRTKWSWLVACCTWLLEMLLLVLHALHNQTIIRLIEIAQKHHNRRFVLQPFEWLTI